MQPLQLFAISSLGLSALMSMIVYHSQDRLMKYFSLFLVFSLCFEVANIFLARQGIRNIVLYNFFHAGSFLFFAYLFMNIIRSARYRKAIKWFMAGFIVFFVLNLIFLQDQNNLLTYPYTIGSLVMIISGAIYFYQVFATDAIEPVSVDPFFWLCFAWLLFYSGTLPMFGMFNYLNNNFPKLTLLYYEYIVYILNIVMNLLFLTGILCQRIFRKRFF
jgi:hypothetical protein